MQAGACTRLAKLAPAGQARLPRCFSQQIPLPIHDKAITMLVLPIFVPAFLPSPPMRLQPPASQPTKSLSMVNVDPTFGYGLPGNLPPFTNFDPLNFMQGKNKIEVYRLREAEITHGRVGMLASLGFFVQETYHPLFDGVGGPAIKQIPRLPSTLWFAMALAIGIAEATRIQRGWANPYENTENVQRLKPSYYPGDLGFDPLNLKPKTPENLRDMQNRELNNGRLAMLAAAGFITQETISGETWGAWWADKSINPFGWGVM